MKLPLLVFLVFLFLFPEQGLLGQQFRFLSGALPGPVVWSEGVEIFDADGDGRMDIIFTNGLGFSFPQGSLAPTLLINHGTGVLFSFQDETSSRLPSGFVQQGKGLTVFDVDGDGDQDLVFANAFLTQPRLLINNGAGIFTDETSLRLPVLSLNSFGVTTADVDNDGDEDLLFCDAGPSLLSFPGGPPHLLINNGSGFFVDSPSQMNGVNKVGAMQITAVDIDNDFDLDVIVDGRSVGQHLYLNDGTGNFTFAGTGVLPPGTSFVYETDWADLDNDGDTDGFYISMSGFNEGTAQNNLLPTGNLSFTGSLATLAGINGNDDNEAAFLDANNDGLLDVLVASLSATQEKLYLNMGTFAPGSFTFLASGFSQVTDSTLDLSIGDLNGDGALDVVTAQGESGTFLNRLYKNTGPQDTLPPTIGRLESVPATVPESVFLGPAAGLASRAWIQDASMDSGRNFISASFSAQVQKEGWSATFGGSMSHSGGGIFRAFLQPPASPTGLVGSDVTFSISAADPNGNLATSPNRSFRICGSSPFGPLGGANIMFLLTGGVPTLGQSFSLNLLGGPAGQSGFLLIGTSPTSQTLAGGTLWVSLSSALLAPILLDGSGLLSIPVALPANPAFAGTRIFLQAGVADPAQPLGLALSNGLEVVPCGN